jgi:hypothetical protein
MMHSISQYVFFRTHGAYAVVLVILFAICNCVWAQEATKPKRLEYIRSENLLNGDLPQGEAFVIFGSISEDVLKVVVAVKKISRNTNIGDSTLFKNKTTIKRVWQRPSVAEASDAAQFDVQIPRLVKNSDYAFRFTFTSKLDSVQLAALNQSLRITIQKFIEDEEKRTGALPDTSLARFLKRLNDTYATRYQDKNGNPVQLKLDELRKSIGTIYTNIWNICFEEQQTKTLSDDLKKSLRGGGVLSKAIKSFLTTKISASSKVNINSRLVVNKDVTAFTFGSFLNLVKIHVLDSLENYDKLYKDQLAFGREGLEPADSTNFFRYLNVVVAAFADSAIQDTLETPLFGKDQKSVLVNLKRITLPGIMEGKAKIPTYEREKRKAYDSTAYRTTEVYRSKAESVSIGSAPVLNYAERLPFYISADVGVSFIPILNETAPYIGINFYFASVDKDVSLLEYGGFFETFRERFSIMIGINLGEVRNEGENLEGVLGKKKIFLGAGYRLTDYLRFGAGVLTYQIQVPNPLVNKQELKGSPYLSVSVDIDAVATIKNLVSAIK